ncbi:MAG TPA: DUF4433 domain-containing protein [Bacteroidetes bacterium]|nr:DUF4433 domain-containing protein [Bacteroidota bacterium]
MPLDLTEVYWDTVGLRYWTNTEEEFDKMRRKQAEFLVRDHVPAQCIAGIITYNKTAADTVKEILGELGLNIPVRINPNNDYYYY